MVPSQPDQRVVFARIPQMASINTPEDRGNPDRNADCFFHRNELCALDLESPCSTFRPDTPTGLVPPRQPALLLRQEPHR